MLRSFFITLSKASWAQRLITRWGFAWRAASRFIAGETPESAIQVVRALNSRGILASLDHLGENTRTPADALQATEEILQALSLIHQAGVLANVSIKLTQIGLAVDETLCRENLERILTQARLDGNFVRLDMEDSSFTGRTLDLYWEMRRKGFDNLGVVIQAYLYRSEADLCKLAEGGARVRLCKGAYMEPAQVAFPQKSDVDANYDRLAELLIDETARQAAVTAQTEDGRAPRIAAIATHDPARIAHARDYAEKLSLPKDAVEFQMLYGIRRDLQDQLAREGSRLRVYIPYGTRWYPYFMRRLAERPANVWFFISNFFRK